MLPLGHSFRLIGEALFRLVGEDPFRLVGEDPLPSSAARRPRCSCLDCLSCCLHESLSASFHVCSCRLAREFCTIVNYKTAIMCMFSTTSHATYNGSRGVQPCVAPQSGGHD